MDSQQTTQTAPRKKARHPVRNTLLFLLIAALIGGGGYLLYQKLTEKDRVCLPVPISCVLPPNRARRFAS